MAVSSILVFLMFLLCLVASPHHPPTRIDLVQGSQFMETTLVQQRGSQYFLYQQTSEGRKLVGIIRKSSSHVYIYKDASGMKGTLDLAGLIQNWNAIRLDQASSMTLQLHNKSAIHLNRSGGVLYLACEGENGPLFVAH